MLGAVGRDDFGANRLGDLQRENISVQAVHQPEGYASGVALITVEASGQNRIAYVPGATSSISGDEGLAALHEWKPACVLTTLELPHSTLDALYREARGQGIPVICNATPEPMPGRALALSADILIVNETEAMDLLGRKGEPGDWVDVAHDLAHGGPSCVVITLGHSGALVSAGGNDLVIAALQVGVVDTTGAGDAFCGAFATELAMGADPFDAARVGVVAGSLAVTKAGAQPSMPTRAEIEARLNG
jgi:ribokinase